MFSILSYLLLTLLVTLTLLSFQCRYLKLNQKININYNIEVVVDYLLISYLLLTVYLNLKMVL